MTARLRKTYRVRRWCGVLRAAILFAALAVPGLLAAQAKAARGGAGTRGGFATDRLVRIDSLLQYAVDDNRIAGAVGLVVRDGQVVYERAVGWADKEARRRMTVDAIFRIASQSKALTSVAALALVEEGKLALTDPVSRYIPAFANTTVSVVRADSVVVVVPARRPIRVQDLLTHTSGMSYGTESRVAALYQAKGLGPAAGYGWYTADKNEGTCETMERLATVPFVAQPGEAWVYGYSTDVLGCVVERASGMPLDAFIRDRITGPLKLRDTEFFLSPGKRDRFTAVYTSDSTGHTVRAPDGPRGQGNYVDGPRRSFSGGAGLLSTAHDYARFLQMIANRGELDGVRILAPHTVDLMTTNQVGTLLSTSGLGFGLGFQTTDRYGANGLASDGAYGWGGADASAYKVDPKERLIIVFMVQLLPNSSDIRDKFQTLVYSALVQSRR